MATAKAPVIKKASSAIKRSRQGELRHARNTSVLSRLKSDEKKLRAALDADPEKARALFQDFTSALDKAAKKGVIHKNAASRKKSRLNVRIAGGAAPVAAKKKSGAKKSTSAAATKAKIAKSKAARK
jgi:small subunit ribosomal protein S20